MPENSDNTVDAYAFQDGAMPSAPSSSGGNLHDSSDGKDATLAPPGVSLAFAPTGEETIARGGDVTQDAAPDGIARAGVAQPRMPERVGRYYPIQLLGEGGMGAVYKAEQRVPIKRLVALKIIRSGHESAAILARFDSERQALARMDHPSIAKVLDAGSENGLPFFVMEYVPGEPITEFADKHRLSIKARLELFMQVCDGIGHAHSKALLHRDIKAQNVLAYLADGKPAVKIIDFGIAKAVGEEKLTNAKLTADVGSVLGTPYAMSPEQAEGSADLDTRTDIYALGVLLYELLGGRLPLAVEELQRKTIREMLELVRLKEPPKLSAWLAREQERAEKIAEARDTKPAALIRELKDELECIPLKAMRKDRDRRYQSALQFSEDIQNYLEGRPISAGPESKLYVARKFVGRNKLRLAIAAAVSVLIVGGTIGYAVQITRERNKTLAANRVAVEKQHHAELSADAATYLFAFSKSVIEQASPEVAKKQTTIREAVKNSLDYFTRDNRFELLDAGVRAELLEETGSIATDMELYEIADQYLNAALVLSKIEFGDLSNQAADVYSLLTILERKRGNFPECEADCSHALGIYRSTAPNGSLMYARALNSRGACFLQRGDSVQAAEYLNKSLAMLTSIESTHTGSRLEDEELADIKDEKAAVLSNLGGIAASAGRFRDAEPLFQQSLDLRSQILKADAPALADCKRNLGYAYTANGKAELAVLMLSDALKTYNDFNDSDLSVTLNCRTQLATALRTLKRYPDAIEQYQESITGLEKFLDRSENQKIRNKLPEAKMLAAAQAGLGNTLLSIHGREAEAELLLRQSFDYRLRYDTPEALDKTIKVLKNLQNAYQTNNQPDQAKKIQELIETAPK